MNFENTKNDSNTHPLPERITLVDCIRLHAAQRHRSSPPIVRPSTARQEDASRCVPRDKLRKIFDDVMDILEDSTFDFNEDE